MKKNNNRKNRVLMIAGITVLSMLVLLSGCSSKKTEEPEEAAPQETAAPTPEPEVSFEPVEVELAYEIVELKDGELQTPYGKIYFPDELSDLLLIANTSAEAYTLEFCATMEEKPEIRLFDISFGEGSGGNMGLVKTEKGEVPMNVVIYALSFDDSWLEGEIITAQAMQDVVNDIIAQFATDAENETLTPDFIQQPEIKDTVNNVEIQTPYCPLYYPAQWGNALRHEHDDSQEDVYKVHFYGKLEGHEAQLLFSIYFGGDEGEQLGAVMREGDVPVPVNILMAELNLSGWDEADAEQMYSMQESSNEVIEKIPFLP